MKKLISASLVFSLALTLLLGLLPAARAEEAAPAEPPKPSNEELLLTEIRDLLKEQK